MKRHLTEISKSGPGDVIRLPALGTMGKNLAPGLGQHKVAGLGSKGIWGKAVAFSW